MPNALGEVEVLPTGAAALVEAGEDPVSLHERLARDRERHKQFERSRVEVMCGYAESKGCWRGYVLDHLGEGFEEPCGRCDNCEAGVVEEDEKWGGGTVQRYEGEEKMAVLFDGVGYKNMVVALVEEHGLLEPVGRDPRTGARRGFV